MATTKGKRWNGNVDALPEEYLNNVIAKMLDYGERVRFSLVSGGPLPSYQVENMMGKTMAFDANHHLAQAAEGEFADAHATSPLGLEQVRAAAAARAAAPARKTGGVRVVRAGSRVAAAKLDQQFATQRYEYFRAHRNMLPASISEHSDEITELMRKGIPVEQAFDEVLKKYF